MKKGKVFIANIIFITSILSGCSKVNDIPADVTIKLFYPSAEHFYQKYGYRFEQEFPNIKVEIVENNYPHIDQHDQPDVIFINDITRYRQLAREGSLYPLELFIHNDNYDLRSINTIVLDQLREEEVIYGLAPSIESSALYFNKKMFNDYDIPFPDNYMTWRDVLKLAQRFPLFNDAGERIYGFETNFYRDIAFLLIQTVGKTQNMAYIDSETLEININTPEWQSIWDDVMSAIQSGSIYYHNLSLEDPTMEYDLFLNGRAAMHITNQNTANILRDKNVSGHSGHIDWGIVTVPVDSLYPVSDYYRIHEIFSIHSNSGHKKEAWEFVKFMNTELMGNYNDLPSRFDLINEVDGRSMDPFIMLEARAEFHNNQAVHHEILQAIAKEASKEIDMILNGEKTIEAALESLQVSGQLAIDTKVLELNIIEE